MGNIVDQIGAVNDNWLLLMALAIFLIVFVIKKNNYISPKYLPLAAPIIGIICGLIATYVTGNDLVIGALDGFLGGLIAAGGKDVISVVIAIVTGKIDDWEDVEDLLDDGKLNESNKEDK